MGPLKDGVFYEVWVYLLTRPNFRSEISSLNNPSSGSGITGIRTAFGELQANGRGEGYKKGTGIKAVLLERPDVFRCDVSHSGGAAMRLTAAAATMQPEGGRLPSKQEVEALGIVDSEPLEPEALASSVPVKRAAGNATGSSSKKRKVEGVGPAQGKGGAYMDLVWTPLLAVVKEREEKLEKGMARALYDAVDMYDGKTVPVSQLGADCKVAALKKSNRFKAEKLLDILRRWEDVFELVPDGKGHFNVALQPGCLAALYDPDELDAKQQGEAILPPKIDNPGSLRDRMQALRIEVVHALHRRGGRGGVTELGSEPGLKRHKQGLPQAASLQNFIKNFPHNFSVTTDEHQQAVVELLSYEVDDQSMIEQALHRLQAFSNPSSRKGQPHQQYVTNGKGQQYRGAQGGKPQYVPQYGHPAAAQAFQAYGHRV